MQALIGVAALAVACSGNRRTVRGEKPSGPPAEYRLGLEDVVQITVWKEPGLSTTVPVRPDGKITVPLVGEVVAADHTANELEAIITERLAQRVSSPVVSVAVHEINSARVFVLGEVARPGAYPLRGAMTALQALALAGGFTEFADRDGIVLIRQTKGGGQEKLSFDFDEAVKGEFPLELRPGDTLVIR